MRNALGRAPVGPRLVVHAEARLGRALFAEAFVDRELARLGVEASNRHAVPHSLISGDDHTSMVGAIAIQCGTSSAENVTRLTSRGTAGLLMSRLTTALQAGTVTR